MRFWRPQARQPKPDKASLDRLTIEQLVRAGADLRVPRVTDHFLYFHTEVEAREAAEALTRPSRVIEVGRAASGARWLVQVHQALAVDFESITALRREFERATQAQGAEYDGWGASAGNDPVADPALSPPIAG